MKSHNQTRGIPDDVFIYQDLERYSGGCEAGIHPKPDPKPQSLTDRAIDMKMCPSSRTVLTKLLGSIFFFGKITPCMFWSVASCFLPVVSWEGRDGKESGNNYDVLYRDYYKETFPFKPLNSNFEDPFLHS